ncbi:unnamed protein product [Parajaminaea phylloscopi]
MLVRSIAATAAALALSALPSALAQTPLSYEVINHDSKVSAMMMGLVNEDYVFILDKVEQNPTKVPGTNKPAWGSLLKLSDNSVTVINVNTNTFCASGVTLGNGSWIVAGGNSPITYGGVDAPDGGGAYSDYDGRKALRMLQPVPEGSDDIQWLDNAGGLQMLSQRWYPGIETLADGSIVLIGGASNGGYINRNYPNTDPAFSGTGITIANVNGGGSNPTYEFYPRKANYPAGNGTLGWSNFMIKTSGLNMYPHTFLLPSGNIFMQANYSTAIWNYTANTEVYLQDMPGQIVRVYPASGATAMLPLTPANNYTPTILFCGGFYADDSLWGDFGAPRFNPLETASSDDCSSITPSNADGSDNPNAKYVREEKLKSPRTMGQFIILPTGQLVVLNGAAKGTAGYGNVTKGALTYDDKVPYQWTNIFTDQNGQEVRTESMSQNPTYTPELYDPEKPLGSRITNTGFGSSSIARLYHSSAILLPDGSILVGGSNPHMDVALNMPKTVAGYTAYNTTYELEKWYPDYYAKDRPSPVGLPSSILYGGNTWSFTVGAKDMGNAANAKAKATKIMVIRGGFSTHAMNMGQRALQLDHSFNVHDDGSVTYTVMPMPKNVNLFPPGPAMLFVTIDGVPSKGKYVIIGSTSFSGTIPNDFAGNAGNEPTLPQSVTNSKYNAALGQSSAQEFGIGKIVGIAVGGAALLLLILLGILCWRRQANKKASKSGGYGAPGSAPAAGAVYGQSSYHDGAGGEYKRVNTPTSSVHAFAAPATRGSLATYDSYKMQDVSGPNTPYFDSPRGANSRSPLGHPSGDYSSQGWGEHQGGDAGDFYRDNMDRSESGAAQYYDHSQYGSHASRR